MDSEIHASEDVDYYSRTTADMPALESKLRQQRDARRAKFIAVALVVGSLAIVGGASFFSSLLDRRSTEDFYSGISDPVKAQENESKRAQAVEESKTNWPTTQDYSQSRSVDYGAGPLCTLSEFYRIANGMSYSQVVSIIGSSGVLSSSSYMEGVPGVMDSIDTRMYEWGGYGDLGANMNCMFQNDKLVCKAQYGLWDPR